METVREGCGVRGEGEGDSLDTGRYGHRIEPLWKRRERKEESCETVPMGCNSNRISVRLVVSARR